MSALPRFSGHTAGKKGCHKCGSIDIHTRHMARCECRSFYDCARREDREHLHRTCRGCGFNWDEAPLDAAVPQGKGTEG